MDILREAEKYYVAVRPQTNDFHPVHRESCPFLPDYSGRIYIGRFGSAEEAGKHGKKYFTQSCSCRFCSDMGPGQEKLFGDRFLPGEKQIKRSTQGVNIYFLN